MLANANPLEAAPASRSVREFVAVLSRHNVPYGDLNCLPILLRELHANKHFAMHFWSAVAGMTDRQSAVPDAVLTAIVEAVTRRTPAEVREAGPAHRILLGRLERLLSGHDVEPEELAGPTPPAEAAAPAVPAGAPNPPVEDVLPIRRVSESKRRRGRKRSSAEPEPIAPITNPAWVRDESLRLTLVPEPPVADPVATPRTQQVAPRRAVLQPDPKPIAIPLSGYAEPRGSVSTGVVAGVIALLALGGGGYLFMRGGAKDTLDRVGTSVRAGYDSAIAAWKSEPAPETASAPAPTATPSAAPPQATSPTQPATPVPASATQQTEAQTAAPVQRSVPKVKPPAPGLTPAQNMAAIAAYNQQREIAQPVTPGAANGFVEVPEAAMNAHLVVSRVPVLPQDARDKGITGVVRMQTTVNRSGYVSRLHVLQGPTELRHAALEAVSAWRYRPYMVNGQPVDVTTTVTVDFSSLD
jgi:TonB family protein